MTTSIKSSFRIIINRNSFLSFLLFTTVLFQVNVDAFRYQDNTSDDCTDPTVVAIIMEECVTTPTRWFTCPITCNEHLVEEGSMYEEHDNPEQVYDMSVVTAKGKKRMGLEDYEGYVTLYAIIPLIPGMSQFYYELLEHVQTVYPYTIQTLIEPLIVKDDDDSTTATTKLTPHNKPKTILLEETSRLTEVSNYLLSGVKQVAGNPNVEFHRDRVTIWLLSADGIFVERLISPDMSLLERRIAVFLKQLEWNPPEF